MKKNSFQHNMLRLTIAGVALSGLTLGYVPFTHASDIKLSGFLSVGGGVVDDDESFPYAGFSEEDLTFENNVLGLQVSGTIAENITATAQMIARSPNNYSVNSEWAYLTWQVSDTTKIRAGRLRSPFYLFSDSLDVGYSYAWITPPQEVYSVPFNNVDGVDIYTTATLGPFDASFQAYFGGFSDEADFSGTPVALTTRNQMGVAATLGKDWWNLRAAYHSSDLWVDVNNAPLSEAMTIGGLATTLTAFGFEKNANALLIEDDKTSFADIGLTIDTGRFVAALEHTRMEVENSFLSSRIREYAMGGVRFDDWLIHLTFSRSKDDVEHPEAGIPANLALPVVGSSNVFIGTLQAIAKAQVETREVVTIGTRWDVTSGTALKFQVDDVDDDNLGDQKVFSVAVQTVF